ncbi:MAG: hypothetical protein KKH44_07675, partial [Bacteroidetes bacterium]|nr:hypothetical protein [Bacteroidota bacterium]
QHNSQQFIDDLKSVHSVVAYVATTQVYIKISKIDLNREAETSSICYYMTDKVYRNRRMAMVVH